MKILILILGVAMSLKIDGQFLGGNYDGADLEVLLSTTTIYRGGTGNGYYGSEIIKNSFLIYSGGSKNGYDSSTRLKSTVSIYSGESNDGHYSTSRLKNSFSIYSGGSKDGYALEKKILSYIWSGTLGNGWNVVDNWVDGVIPNINSSVIIPSGLINYPKINAGLMSIGQDLNGGLYLCKRLLIRENAEMTLRVNSTLENYGDIEIRGSLIVLSTSTEAIQNLSGAHIILKPGGLLMWE